VRVAVFDLNGRRVRTLLDEDAPAGLRAVEWNGRDARGALQPAGVYVIRATAGSASATRRVVRIR